MAKKKKKRFALKKILVRPNVTYRECNSFDEVTVLVNELLSTQRALVAEIGRLAEFINDGANGADPTKETD